MSGHLEMFDDRIAPRRLGRKPHARNGHAAQAELKHGVGVPGDVHDQGDPPNWRIIPGGWFSGEDHPHVLPP